MGSQRVTHLLREAVDALLRLRNHLTANSQFLGRLRGVGGDGDGFLETTRTAIRVVSNGDVTGLPRLNRSLGPSRSGATARSAHVGQYQRSHSFVFESENSGYSAVSFVYFTKVVVCFFECDNRLLSEQQSADSQQCSS